MTNILPADVSTCTVPSAFPTLNAVYPPSITVPAGTVTGSGYATSNITIDNAPPAGTAVALTDDAFGGPYPIGFTFNFYGVNYTNFYISANGYIGFTSPLPNTFQYDGNDMTDIATLCASNTLPNNAIFGYFQDFNPNGVANGIRYQTTGVAPNRALTVYYTNLPFFSSCTGTSSFRIKIFETTGVIQIHINNKPVCTGMWTTDDGFSGLAPQCPATVSGGCPAYTSAGSDVALNNVAFQYTPFIAGSTAPITATMSGVTWTGLSGNANSSFNITNTTNTTASPIVLGSAGQSPKKYIIKVTYDVPCATDVVYVDTFVIRYVAPPTSLFTATETGDVASTSICMSETATITYTGNATPPLSAYTFLWNFDGGTATPATGGAGPFQISWSTPGTKNITLKVIAGTCTSAVTTKQIIVNPTPTSNFTVSNATLCLNPATSTSGNTTVTFTGVVLPTPATAPVYAWNWSGGTVVSGTGAGPYVINWGTSGTKNITLTVSQNGCTSIITTVPVSVNDAPTSAFTVSNSINCLNPVTSISANTTVTFTGNVLAAPPATAPTYTWNWNGGTVVSGSGAGPYVINWGSSGIKNITLTVSQNGCTSTVTTVPVTVNAAPTSTFTVSNATLCLNPVTSISENTTVTFTGNVLASPPATAPTYTWNWNGGTVVSGSGAGPYVINWVSSGIKNITLTVSQDGCTSTVTTVPVTVNAALISTFSISNATLCMDPVTSISANTTVTFTGNVLATPPATAPTYTWNWNGGTVVSGSGVGPYVINWGSSGVKNVTLSVSQNGCISNTTTNTIEVYDLPNSSFTFSPANVCVGAQTTLTCNGNGPTATYNWTAGTGSLTPGGSASNTQQVSFPASGSPSVSLIVTENGCVSPSTSQTLTINPTPTATFTVPSSVCPDVDVLVDYTGTGSTTASYTWSFDGGNATQLGPNNNDSYNVNWTTPGIKTISLIVSEFGCASQPFTRTVEVYPIPTSTFTALTPVCVGSSSTINYSGSAATSAIYNWTFLAGTPATANTQGPHSVSWLTSGTYNLNLTVTENGCVSSPTQVQVIVNPIPTSSFTASNPVCLNGTGTLLYNGTAPANALFTWDLGGGNSNVTVGPGPIVVDWSSIGTKTLTLNVVSLGCASTTSSIDIEVLALPIVNAGSDIEVCSGAIVPMGTIGDPLYSYQWTPLLGITDPTESSSTIQLQNNSPNTQTYQFTLTANDGQCSDTDAMLFSVTAPPTVVFNIPPGQCFEGNSFDFEAVGEFTTSANFVWSFGPNANVASSSILNPSNITFNTSGSQNVSLQVDDSGCFSNLFTSNVQVFEEPTADFDADITSGCMPLKVNYFNMSTVPTSLMSYTWNFGIGNPSSSSSPSFNYEDAGVYDVSLFVETPQGCSDTIFMDSLVHVFPVPTSGFILDKFEATVLEPQIEFTSNALNADSAWYVISSGDTLFGFNQNYNFPDSAGIYSIMQYVSNEYACTDSTDRSITITTGYKIFIPNSFSPNSDDINEYFKPVGEGITSYHITIFNRWGQQVYASYDYENGWDGRDNSGNIIMPGAYFFKIDLIDEKNYDQHVEGVINVLH